MRISDWSSDVCSSDLARDEKRPAAPGPRPRGRPRSAPAGSPAGSSVRLAVPADLLGGRPVDDVVLQVLVRDAGLGDRAPAHRDAGAVHALRARKSVVSGKSVLVRVNFGGRRCMKKKK